MSKIFISTDKEDVLFTDVLNDATQQDFYSKRKILRDFPVGKKRASSIFERLIFHGILERPTQIGVGAKVLVSRSNVVLAGKKDQSVEEGYVSVEEQELPNVLAPNAIKADGTIMSIDEYCETYNIPFDHAKSYKLCTHIKGYASYNIQSKTIDTSYQLEEFKRLFLEEIQRLPSPELKFQRDSKADPHCLVIGFQDLHIGKYSSATETGSEYNIDIATQRVSEGIQGILNKVSGFNIEKIIISDGGDLLHIDSVHSATTKGTRQDSAIWHECYIAAVKIMVNAIYTLSSVADIEYTHASGNHDRVLGFTLGQLLQARFMNESWIKFHVSPNPIKYIRYYNNLLAFAHGDKMSQTDLTLTIADECEFWSECKYRYAILGHLHHKIQTKENNALVVETLSSISGTDSYHRRHGYNAKPAMEGLLYSREYGQVSRITHNFKI